MSEEQTHEHGGAKLSEPLVSIKLAVPDDNATADTQHNGHRQT